MENLKIDLDNLPKEGDSGSMLGKWNEEEKGISIGRIANLNQMAEDIQSNLGEVEYSNLNHEMWICRMQGFIAGVVISIICYFLLK